MALKLSDLPEKTLPSKKLPRTRKLYTVAEWLDLPERPHTELVEGAIKRMPPPSYNHAEIILNIRAALREYILTNKLGQLGGEMAVIIDGMTGKNGWIPDSVFVSKDNRARIGKTFVGVPDWVLEVWAGEEKKPRGVAEKRGHWQRAGAQELWEVSVEGRQQTVNVYRLDEKGVYRIVPQEGSKICSAVIAGFCMDRSAIFANLIVEG